MWSKMYMVPERHVMQNFWTLFKTKVDAMVLMVESRHYSHMSDGGRSMPLVQFDLWFKSHPWHKINAVVLQESVWGIGADFKMSYWWVLKNQSAIVI